MRLYLLALPVTVAVVLQASGCTSSSVTQAMAGGTYISASAGAHFDQAVDIAGSEEGENIAKFVLRGAYRHEKSPDNVYVAAGSKGIVFSDSGGAEWQVISTPLSNVTDVLVLNNGVLVAAGTDGQGQGFVLRSSDEGKSWQTVLTIPVPIKTQRTLIGGGTAGTQSVVISIAPDPFTDDQVYAGTSLGNVLLGELSAKTWRTVATLDTNTLSSSQSRGKFAIVDTIPSPHVRGEVFLITNDGSLFRLNSETQEEISVPRNLNTGGRFSFSGRSRLARSVAFILDEAETMLVGVDDGAVASRDKGTTWQELPLPIDVVRNFNSAAVAVSPTNSSRILVGINGVVYRSEDGGASWNTFSLGLKNHAITSLLIDPTNAANVVAVTTPLGA